MGVKITCQHSGDVVIKVPTEQVGEAVPRVGDIMIDINKA
jgi:hypothetical protein